MNNANRYRRELAHLVVYVSAFLLLSCASAIVQHQAKVEDLFIPESELPPGWAFTSQPQPMGPTIIGFGDEKDDRFVNFYSNNDPERLNIAGQYIMRFDNIQRATEWYQSYAPSYFDPTRMMSELQIHSSGLSFQSKSATQFLVGCTAKVVGQERQSCQLLAQYDNYVVLFSSVIAENILTFQEFDRLVQVIDQIFSQNR